MKCGINRNSGTMSRVIEAINKSVDWDYVKRIKDITYDDDGDVLDITFKPEKRTCTTRKKKTARRRAMGIKPCKVVYYSIEDQERAGVVVSEKTGELSFFPEEEIR